MSRTVRKAKRFCANIRSRVSRSDRIVNMYVHNRSRYYVVRKQRLNIKHETQSRRFSSCVVASSVSLRRIASRWNTTKRRHWERRRKRHLFSSCCNRLRQISGPDRGERLRLAGKNVSGRGQLAFDKRLQTATRGDVKTACVPACLHVAFDQLSVDRSIVATDDDDDDK